MSFVLTHLVKIVAGIAAFGVAIFLAVQWGKALCRADYEAAIGKIKAEYAERVVDASNEAAKRAIDAYKKDLENEKRVGRIEDEASKEPNANDVCLSASIVDRLRELQ